MAKGNPNPVITPEFEAAKIKPIGDLPGEPLGEKPLAVRVGKSIYESVSALSQKDRINWLRRVITEAAQRELMGNDSEPATGSAIADPDLSTCKRKKGGDVDAIR